VTIFSLWLQKKIVARSGRGPNLDDLFADSSPLTPFWQRASCSPNEPAATGSISHVQGLPDPVKAQDGLALHKFGQQRLSPIALGFAHGIPPPG
jgi:hypothetical protein